MGYSRAGFDEIVGVDIKPQPRYPFRFVQADALEYLACFWPQFDAIHASPPCQRFTTSNARYKGRGGKADDHPDLLTPIALALRTLGKPFVIENVEGAARHFRPSVRLTGRMFGLSVWRPRLFEVNPLILAGDPGRPSGVVIGVYGDRPDGRLLNSRCSPRTGNRAARSLAEAQAAMGMPWADWHGCTQAIPPAYTTFIGKQLLESIQSSRAWTEEAAQ